MPSLAPNVRFFLLCASRMLLFEDRRVFQSQVFCFAVKSPKLSFLQEKCLIVPKREIFVTKLFTLSDSNWIGDLETEAKNNLCNVLG
jgi:hypothetical protein